MENLDKEVLKEMRNESLRYITDAIPGFFRQKNRNTFSYYDIEGKKITSEKALERIRNLVIPPAWKDVWISPIANGHLQATGIDDRGRKQYKYHEDWIKITQQNKFSKMIDFGLSLPQIRQKVSYDMKLEGLDKRKIIATVIWLLEHTFIRIGNEEYQKENNSFGLTTLRNKHVKVHGSEIVLRFRGKSGVENLIEVTNPTIAKTIKKCIELPGYELFQYIDDSGTRHVIDSQDVNDFLKEITNDDFTAKDFRTWGATNLSSHIFYRLGEASSPSEIKKNVKETIKRVADHLNNTAAVCRNYYIHPTVIKTYSKKILVPHFNTHKERENKVSGLSWSEEALVQLLKKYS
ncbi:MAG: DNA topoisomerase IB [Candidatus Levybacteria bacterium]|nr:DNA topoisomerase IB [Candidatus Levybacteria bacterium]